MDTAGSVVARGTGTPLLQMAGTFTVTRGGAELPPTQLGSRRGRLLLQLLCVERPNNVSVEQIAAVLWPDGPPADTDAAVATLVSRLRSVLGTEVIVGRRGSYRLGDGSAVEVDMDRAAALIDEAERRVDTEPGTAASAAARAMEVLGSGVLAEARYDDWAEPARVQHASGLRRARLAAARALTLGGDPAAAAEVAEALVVADPLDEAARRTLMSAYLAAGEPARALGTYDDLRTVLRDELGIDPSHASQDLYLTVLRAGSPELAPSEEPTGDVTGAAPGLVGRSTELAALRSLWEAANRGQPATVLISGESGIGKTRLADEFASDVARTGGTVLRARCYQAERSLFMQPILNATEAELGRCSAAALRGLVGPDAAELAAMMPMIGRVLTVGQAAGGTDAFRRRRSFEAVTGLLARLTGRAPVLMVVDDVHNAGRSTLEMIHYLARHVGPARLLVVLTARVEGASQSWRRLLPDASTELELGPLGEAAVRELAAEAGHEALADRISQLTGGHTLYVVEVLRALSAGSDDLPSSLRDTVLDKVGRTGPAVETLLRAAAVVGNRLEPELLSQLVGIDLPDAIALCEQALSARLLAVNGQAYEFGHDVVREVLYATTPGPTLAAYHRRAADLLADRPEQLAVHAAAVGDWERAARAWVLAADQAMLSLAALDARSLAGHALEAAETACLVDVQARALLLRGRAREVTAEYVDALADFEQAADLARAAGDDRLHMRALRELGGDVPTALGIPVDQHSRRLEAALRIAESLGDRVMQPELLSRMAVVNTNRLKFVDALRFAQRGVDGSRGDDDPRALAIALDGLKTVYAYLGDIDGLMPVVAELEPLLRRQNDQWRLQWLVFESAFEPLAAGRFDDALALVDVALQLNRASGYVSYEAWFLAHLGWMHRLSGDLDRAVDVGRRALVHAERFGHAWWAAATAACLAVSLLERGDREEATGLLNGCLPVAETSGAEGYLARCLGPLALATGERAPLERADRLLTGVSCPPGRAWLLGADAYVCTAKAWLGYDEQRAGALLRPFVAAAESSGWSPLVEAAAAVVPAAT